MNDNPAYIDERGVIYETDDNGITHVYQTDETCAELESFIQAADRLAAILGYSSVPEMLHDHFGGDRGTMSAAVRKLIDRT